MLHVSLQIYLWGLLFSIGCQLADDSTESIAAPSDQSVVHSEETGQPEAELPETPPFTITTRPGEAHLEPAVLPEITPAQITGDRSEIILPDIYSKYAVGGGGRFFIFYLRNLRQLTIFDVSKGKIVKTIPVHPNDLAFAASADKLVVVRMSNQQRVIERFSLLTFEKELTRTLSNNEIIIRMVMGSGSNGPIFCNNAFQNEPRFYDLDTLEPSAIQADWPKRESLRGTLNASTNGRAFGHTKSGSQMISIILGGTGIESFRESNPRYDPLFPGPEGELFYSTLGARNKQLKIIDSTAHLTGIPATHGRFFLHEEKRNSRRTKCAVHLVGQKKPLLSSPFVEKKTDRKGRLLSAQNEWQRYYLIPSAEVMVYLPLSNNQIDLYRIKFEDAAESCEFDYLFVTSLPITLAKRGETYEYPIKARSKQGGIQYQIAAGPPGMTVSSDGVVQWQVPVDYPRYKASVLMSLTDASQQTIFHKYEIAVRGKWKPDENARPRSPSSEIRSIASTLPKITPAQFEGEKKQIKLPAQVSDMVVGAGGRYLFLYLKHLNQIAVFDSSKAKIIKYLPLLSDDICFTAGAQHLIVIDRKNKMIQRWNLSTLESDATVPFPLSEPVFRSAMGHASLGPVILMMGESYKTKSIQFLDPQTLKLKNISPTQLVNNSQFAHWEIGNYLQVSGGGQVAVVNNRIMILSVDNTYEQYTYGLYNKFLDSRDHLLLNYDGSMAYSKEDFYSRFHPKHVRQSKRLQIRLFPATESGFYFDSYGSIYLENNKKFLDSMTSVDPKVSLIRHFENKIGLDFEKRYTLVPSANILVQFPASCEELIVHKVDIDELLEKKGDDYFFLTSNPVPTAPAGQLWQYQIQVRSKKGGVKYKLGSGFPHGMTVSPTGLVSWKVPEKYPLSKVNLEIYLEDNSGKKIVHSFAVFIPSK
ncbi:hypothetical protein [uncultured Gimesia sp.]|uniref:hypothetical protein n=1 Tax=uncultured Gimesia sp. TaxID=1678688 RepID=UPI0030D7ED19|tara:strand:- start:74966 stop:77743 length:2778 start_codon:yes stop_codon:yes gene_type:complete